MNFLDVIGPGDPGYHEFPADNNITQIIIVGAVIVVVAAVLITAVIIKKNSKKGNK